MLSTIQAGTKRWKRKGIQLHIDGVLAPRKLLVFNRSSSTNNSQGKRRHSRKILEEITKQPKRRQTEGVLELHSIEDNVNIKPK